MTTSQQLLAEYIESTSEPAFRELVTRYINLVYAAASRQVEGDRHLAEDIAQTVFMDLANMAKKLPKGVMLGGWLHRHTCYVAATIQRGERRRRDRETTAVEMNAIQDHTAANLAQVIPILDEAINRLGAEDRQAILLRFFDQCDFKSVGEALGSSEEAARKRVSRALEKLHGLLGQRGVAFSTVALATALAKEAVAAAPMGLTTKITSAALSNAAVATASTANLFHFMNTIQAKTVIFSAILIFGVATPLVMQRQAQTKLRAENLLLREQLEEMAKPHDEPGRLANVRTQGFTTSISRDTNFDELLRLRGEVGVLRRELAEETERAKTNGVRVKSPQGLESEKLLTRTFKLDPKTFPEGVQGMTSTFDAGATQAGDSETSLDARRKLQTQIRNYFVAAGVNFSDQPAPAGGLAPAPQKALFFNERTGVLLVRATLHDLDVVEEAVRTANMAEAHSP